MADACGREGRTFALALFGQGKIQVWHFALLQFGHWRLLIFNKSVSFCCILHTRSSRVHEGINFACVCTCKTNTLVSNSGKWLIIEKFKVIELPDIPATPHQPDGFIFLKQLCGTSMQCFRTPWLQKFTFLDYEEAMDVVYCHFVWLDSVKIQ